MRRWHITKCDAKREPVEWRLVPWTIVKVKRGDSEAFALWKNGRAKPECLFEDLDDAMRFAVMYEDND